jgi:hypothetical protein
MVSPCSQVWLSFQRWTDSTICSELLALIRTLQLSCSIPITERGCHILQILRHKWTVNLRSTRLKRCINQSSV